MFHALRLMIAEGAFIFAWGTANLGVKLLPKKHPIRTYHEFSRERVRTVYIKATRAERS